MSRLPDQEIKTSYSQDDVQHIVAREMAKQQLVQLQSGQLEINKRLVEIVSEFKTELKAIKEMLDKTPQEVDACKMVQYCLPTNLPKSPPALLRLYLALKQSRPLNLPARISA